MATHRGNILLWFNFLKECLFNMCPSKPRSTNTWDVHLVTKTNLLPLKLLNELHPLQSWTFHTSLWPWKEFLSHSCLGESKALQINYLKPFFRPFHTMRDCPVYTLLHHLKATRNICLVFPSLKPHPSLISYVKPHNPITVPTQPFAAHGLFQVAVSLKMVMAS